MPPPEIEPRNRSFYFKSPQFTDGKSSEPRVSLAAGEDDVVERKGGS
jgi:hypothetical protein